ncbi:MAG: GT4 family glycosyltransferase PelF [Burkholderiaceae bacterium]|nr:GT4 family glycosyltransferase PelF [Burkholderiaceae bacterium]
MSNARKQDFPTASNVDVLLLLEGTFPYVAGGVSSWVNQIIRGFPQLRFGAIFLGSRRADYGELKYPLPDNLVHLECHYLHEHANEDYQPAPADGDAEAFARVASLHERYREARAARGSAAEAGQAIEREFAALLPQMRAGGALDERAFLHSRESWRMISDNYRARCTDPSFVDYFWTIRIMHAPVWRLLAIADRAPRARVLHTISTGYAGFLGALLRHIQGAPLLLSEHGIYTKERKIDLFQSTWIRDNRGVFERRGGEVAYFKDLWIRFFEALGRSCYAASSRIVALYEANRRRQIADGAPEERTLAIPNGIDLERFAKLRELRPADPPPVLCLIGRVVPIKDVKTFIRAMRSVVARIPDAQAWIAGPEDEDPEYARECRLVVESLKLEEHVKFLGFQKVPELLPKIGLVVLSSISEALPLVLLEGFAAGVPCVATDVGSCRQLVYGHGPEDEALGAAGEIVQIADPQALADAAVRLLADPHRWRQAAAAGIARVERYYTQARMFAAYQALYDEAMGVIDESPSPRPSHRVGGERVQAASPQSGGAGWGQGCPAHAKLPVPATAKD